jgi:hypothetical protein
MSGASVEGEMKKIHGIILNVVGTNGRRAERRKR